MDERLFQVIQPDPVGKPALVLWNESLAEQLNITASFYEDAAYFTGNKRLPGSEPVALAYCGHQFGHFNPDLGDGRAHLLGELIDRDGARFDIQLKGSGVTQFSRQGDGRCALGPAVREFVMSEAMHALGVPTSRCLAVATTGEAVYREQPLAGAVVTRIASSHIRVGTFQYVAMRAYQEDDPELMASFCDYVIDRHFTACKNSDEPVLAMFEAIIEKQIALVVEWLRIGFIHGVMNTDNTAISGETIDFGPCAMLGQYSENACYSSIDRRGRYAFGNQRNITLWNMTRLAEALLPLLEQKLGGEDNALEALKNRLNGFQEKFDIAYYAMMAGKLGFEITSGQEQLEGDKSLIDQLTHLMATQQLDYTITFEKLTRCLRVEQTQCMGYDFNDDQLHIETEQLTEQLEAQLGDWFQRWHKRLALFGDAEKSRSLMANSNPVVIPRNHHVEAVIDAAYQGDFEAVNRFLAVLRSPYQLTENTHLYQDAPADGDSDYRTFCGT